MFYPSEVSQPFVPEENKYQTSCVKAEGVQILGGLNYSSNVPELLRISQGQRPLQPWYMIKVLRYNPASLQQGVASPASCQSLELGASH